MDFIHKFYLKLDMNQQSHCKYYRLLLSVLENYCQSGDLQILLLYIKKVMKKNLQTIDQKSNQYHLQNNGIYHQRYIIMEDFLSKEFFSNNQYGFIQGRSTVLSLLIGVFCSMTEFYQKINLAKQKFSRYPDQSNFFIKWKIQLTYG